MNDQERSSPDDENPGRFGKPEPVGGYLSATAQGESKKLHIHSVANPDLYALPEQSALAYTARPGHRNHLLQAQNSGIKVIKHVAMEFRQTGKSRLAAPTTDCKFPEMDIGTMT